ncbi:MAG: hypothetical protein P4L36_07365 [Holophaga sp.]|nr:hypothetical protein [Holophaga sp.]
MTVATLLGVAACKGGGPAQVTDRMARRSAELDQLGQQEGNAGMQQVPVPAPEVSTTQTYSAWLHSGDEE